MENINVSNLSAADSFKSQNKSVKGDGSFDAILQDIDAKLNGLDSLDDIKEEKNELDLGFSLSNAFKEVNSLQSQLIGKLSPEARTRFENKDSKLGSFSDTSQFGGA